MLIMQETTCIVCGKAFRALSSDDTYFCRVCDEVAGNVCPACLKKPLQCPRCSMPLRKKEDPVYRMGGMY